MTSTPLEEPTRDPARRVPASRRAGLVLVCAAGVVWGTIGPAVDVVHDRSSLSALTIGGHRAVAAVVVLGLVTTVVRQWRACRALVRGHGGRVLLTGALTAMFQLLFFVAVLAIGVSVTTVVALGVAPLLLLVLSCVRHGRPPTLVEALTVGTALLGLVLVGATGSGATDVSQPVWGVLAALGSGSAYALAAEVGGSLSREHDALVVATCTTAVVTAVLVPLGLLPVLLQDAPLLTSDVGAWALVAYLGVVTMAFAYVLLYAGLRSTTSGAAVVATLLEPVTAMLLAVLLLGEQLTLAGAVGCLLILGAIAGLGRAPEPPPQ